jgi:hypothetical protein
MKQVTETFTLSRYDGGKQIKTGVIPKGFESQASFSETLGPLVSMIRQFAGLPLGTKIKVTMEVENET